MTRSRRPLTLSDSRRTRFFTLSVLYFAQGVPWGFVTIALVAFLSKSGASAAETGGLVALSVLPWTFKIVWGPLIDSFRLPRFGQRRPWIVVAQACMALTLLVTVSSTDLTSEASLALLGGVLFVHNAFASLQDVATDALAIDVLREDERGAANGLMLGSKLVGVSAGGAGLATLLVHFDLATGMRVLAGFLLVVMLVPLFVLERAGDKRFPWSRPEPGDLDGNAGAVAQAPTNPLVVARSLVRALGTRVTFLGLFVAAGLLLCEGTVVPLNAEVFTQRLGWSVESYSYAHAIYGTGGKILGAIVCGVLCDRIGCRKALVAGVGLMSGTVAVFSLTEAWWTSASYPFGAYLAAFETGHAMSGVAAFTLFMKLSWTAAAATQYTLYMTVANLGFAFGSRVAGLELAHASIYLLAAALPMASLALLPLVDPAAITSRKRRATPTYEPRLDGALAS